MRKLAMAAAAAASVFMLTGCEALVEGLVDAMLDDDDEYGYYDDDDDGGYGQSRPHGHHHHHHHHGDGGDDDYGYDGDDDGYGRISVDYKIKFDRYFSRRNILEIEVMPS